MLYYFVCLIYLSVIEQSNIYWKYYYYSVAFLLRKLFTDSNKLAIELIIIIQSLCVRIHYIIFLLFLDFTSITQICLFNFMRPKTTRSSI